MDPPRTSAEAPEATSSLQPTVTRGTSVRSSRNTFAVDPAHPGNIPRPDPNLRRPQSIRIRRLPSSPSIHQTDLAGVDGANVGEHGTITGRRRSTSAPQRPRSELLGQPPARLNQMDTVAEEPARQDPQRVEQRPGRSGSLGSGRLRRASLTARNKVGSILERNAVSSPAGNEQSDYEREIVDILDVVDPEVATLNSLTNVQNSLFVPNLGRLINRHPTYNLSRRPTNIAEESADESELKTLSLVTSQRTKTRPEQPPRRPEGQGTDDFRVSMSRMSRTASITSQLSQTEGHYAVLPHGISLTGWSEEDKMELNDHVRHLLHSKRAKFKRRMKAFGKYVRKPLGFFVTLYAILITLFGLAWVLFLIGWINVGGRQLYIINVIDNVLVALFAVVGDGLAPFRAVDTYHMCFIAHYHHLTWRLRRERNLPQLQDHNDLPEKRPTEVGGADDTEAGNIEGQYSMLSPKQQKRLVNHQNKFSSSHSFYKPHETATHFAFPLRLLVAIVVLLDCHSLFQIALGTCTWAISYHTRPQALTATILCCSITCNITAGVLIAVGDRRTRKKEVVTKMLRQALTEEALRKMEKDRAKQVEDFGIADGGPGRGALALLSHEDSRERDKHGRVIEQPGQGHALSRRA